MNKKKVIALAVAAVLIGVSIWLAGFSYGRGHTPLEKAQAHEHGWSQWADPTASPDTSHGIDFIQFRHCTNCGMAEFRPVLRLK